jgi:hypothetical protein
MRNIHCDQGNARFAIRRRDNRSDVLVGLKFDDQVHFFAHQQVGIAPCDLRVVAVIERNEFDSLCNCRSLQTAGYLTRELTIGSLRGVSESIEFLSSGPKTGLTVVLAHLFDHAAFLQGLQQPKRPRLREAAPRGDFSEWQGFSGRAKGSQQPRRVNNRFNQISVPGTDIAVRNHSTHNPARAFCPAKSRQSDFPPPSQGANPVI